MALQFDGTNWLTYGGRPLNSSGIGTEWSAMVWYFVANDPAAFNVIAGDNTLSTPPGHLFFVDQSDAARTDLFRSGTNDGDGNFSFVNADSESIVNGTWHNLITTWKQNDNHHFYIDGAEVSDGPTVVPDFGFDFSASAFSVGARVAGTNRSPNGDRIAENAYWNRILSADEIAAAPRGAAPIFFHNGLIWYCQYKDENDTTDLIGGNAATENGAGALISGEHPPIIYPNSVLFPVVSVAAAGVTHPVNPFGHPFAGPHAGPIS